VPEDREAPDPEDVGEASAVGDEGDDDALGYDDGDAGEDEEEDDGDAGDGAGGDEPLFGRFDAATLLAIEAANGGEWASLGQVIVTFKTLFGELPDADGFAESCGLLCDAGLVEFTGEGLDLHPAGRKLLRRAGRHGNPARPAKVTELLLPFDEGDLGEEGAVATPTAEEVAAALEALTAEMSDELGSLQAANQSRLLGPPIVLPGFGSQATFSTLPDLGGGWSDDEEGTDDPEADWSPEAD
jgi:hypothetical protein